SPYFSAEDKKDGLDRMIKDAPPVFMNFLEALVERHRMPAIFRIRDQFESYWDKENKLLPVQVISAVELDKSTVKSIGKQIGDQTGLKIELSSDVDPDIVGGLVLRVGNFVLDASIRSRLNELRKQVAQA
ncbi:MAG: ATP synthase F1 subunit delta, partial [Solirubrobacterales bacterium]|nr:ATP synthase F1 subunit delta [Solirubrobacterales bacterium]